MMDMFEIKRSLPPVSIRAMFRQFKMNIEQPRTEIERSAFVTSIGLFQSYLDSYAYADLSDLDKAYLIEQRETKRLGYCDLYPPQNIYPHVLRFLYVYHNDECPSASHEILALEMKYMTLLFEWMERVSYITIELKQVYLNHIEIWSRSTGYCLQCCIDLRRNIPLGFSEEEGSEHTIIGNVFTIDVVRDDIVVLRDRSDILYTIPIKSGIGEKLNRCIGFIITAQIIRDKIKSTPGRELFRYITVGKILPPMPPTTDH